MCLIYTVIQTHEDIVKQTARIPSKDPIEYDILL